MAPPRRRLAGQVVRSALRRVRRQPVQIVWRGGANETASIPRKIGEAVGKHIQIEEFHLTVCAPCGLSAQAYDALRQVLDDPPLHARLRRTFRRVVCRPPALSKAQVRLSR
jgi:hypothetical protein